MFFKEYGAHRDLHSFPTRRSSDLVALRPGRRPCLFAPFAFKTTAGGASALGGVSDRPREGKRHMPLYEHVFLRSEEHTSELQSRRDLVCRLLLEKKKKTALVS